MRSGFFNSDIQGYDDNGNPLYDRAEDAEFFAKYFSSFIGNGVYPNPSSNFQVEISDGMHIKVNQGLAFVEGYFAWEETERTLAVQAAHASYDRIDRVVLRLNFSNRNIDLYIVKGTPTSSPVPPTLERPISGEGGGIYELSLAELFIAKNSTSIPQHRITDTRADTEVCGLVSGVVHQVDTSTLYKQYQDSLNEFLDTVQSALDETTAGNLQNQINKIKNTESYTLNVGGWSSYGTDLYAQTFSVSGVTEEDYLDWDVDLSDVANAKASVEPVLEAFGNILKIETYNGGIRVVALELPTVTFDIKVKGV